MVLRILFLYFWSWVPGSGQVTLKLFPIKDSRDIVYVFEFPKSGWRQFKALPFTQMGNREVSLKENFSEILSISWFVRVCEIEPIQELLPYELFESKIE